MIISNDLKTVPVQLVFLLFLQGCQPINTQERQSINILLSQQIKSLYFSFSHVFLVLSQFFFFFQHFMIFFYSFSELLYVVTKPESSPWLKAYFHNFSVLFLYFYLLNVISHSLSFLRTLLSTRFALSDSLPLFLYSFLYTHVWYWTPQSHVLCTWVK